MTIDWTFLPADATVVTGCVNKTFTADTPPGGTDAFCSVDDGAATVTVQLKIRVDKRRRSSRADSLPAPRTWTGGTTAPSG